MLIIPISTKGDRKQPPYACIALILINVFILFFLQTGDDDIQYQAHSYYETSGLLAIEIKAYTEYLAEKGEIIPEIPQDREKERYRLAEKMLADEKFTNLLEDNRIIRPGNPEYKQWREKRDAFTAILEKSVTHRYGYSPRKNNLHGLFTCMYLHGGIMHLVGNMVFLWLTGAILEAAIETLPFLLLYTITGICASALFGLVYPLSPGPLIGASGAIAGLMGAYGIIFGLRKIRVFYSLGFYFNYANVPALVLFPVWLANEFLQLYTNVGSHVAYVAHIGGLLSGIAIGTGYRFWKKDRIESLFAGEKQQSEVEALFDQGMARLANLDLTKARADFLKILSLEPENSRAIRQLFHIDKGSPDSDEFHNSAHRLLQHLRRTAPEEYLAVFDDYKQTTGKPRITVEVLEQLSYLHLTGNDFKQATACIAAMLRQAPENGKLPGFLYSLAKGYHRTNQGEEARKCLRILATKYGFTPEGAEAERFLDRSRTN
jgi:membrane associated rhomboid family serine protease